MVSFIAIDLTLLVLFTLFVFIFIYTRKHNLKREGLIYLYRTSLGLKAIENTARKFKSILKPLQYLVILSGYILMILMIWALFATLFIYINQPDSSPISKVPAVFPLIPYFPELFGLDSVFPPFYFFYFIVSIAIVAVSHEFSHGIFARLNKIKIHSTGFAFLGPFLGAFVEQDEKQMLKAKKFHQLSILAAGTFANVIMMILFGIILILFFSLAFTPAGFIFNTYATAPINISQIDSVNGQPISLFDQEDQANLSTKELIEIKIDNETFFADPAFLSYSLENNIEYTLAFQDSPAFNARLKGAIIELDYTRINSYDSLVNTLSNHNPGDTINIKTINSTKEITEYNIVLGEREGKSFLGIGTYPRQSRGFMSYLFNLFTQFKDPNIYYESNIGVSGQFIYDLLWWIVIINLLVALFNMYPAGILDGGRFLMLTLWGITGSKKIGEKSLNVMTWLLLAIIAIMMVRWVFAFF
ncbi:MAG: site-2 protease family protein [Nanoarchaeota archaeon]